MAFHEITGIIPLLPVSAEQFPVFLLPDITCDGIGLLHLSRQLQAARGNKSQIYIWHDPHPSLAGKSLSTYAEKMRDEIMRLLPAGPCFISGYSFGGSLISVVAQKLIIAGRQVAPYIIDTPTIEDSQAYFKPQNAAASRDLIAIFTYAASLACCYALQTIEMPTFTAEEIKNLSQRSIEEQINFLKEFFVRITTANEKLSLSLNQYADVISQNLLSLMQHPIDISPQILSKIGLFLSEESLQKYGPSVAKSWERYCCQGEVNQLASSTHLSLLTDTSNSSIIANKMATYFSTYFTPEEMIIMLQTLD